MRILLVITEMGAGGAERVVSELANHLPRLGHEVALAAAPGIYDDAIAAAGIRRYRLTRSGRRATELLRSVRELRRALVEFRPDVVHVQNVKYTAASRLALAGSGTRPALLATFQGVSQPDYGRAVRIFRLADQVACVSEELRSELVRRGLSRDHLVVIKNAVPESPALPEARRHALRAELGVDDDYLVSIVARLAEQKNHRRFLDAIRLLPELDHPVRCAIVGDGPLRAMLEHYARTLDLGERVLFTGFRDDSRDVAAVSDLVVFTSDWEGLSLAALESLAAGVPVISTPAHGMEELLTSSGAGRMVAGDPHAVAQAIASLLEDAELRAAMGARGRELIRREYSVDEMVDAYAAWYRRSVRSPALRPGTTQ